MAHCRHSGAFFLSYVNSSQYGPLVSTYHLCGCPFNHGKTIGSLERTAPHGVSSLTNASELGQHGDSPGGSCEKEIPRYIVFGTM